jgi:hypothetical protein
MTTYQDPPLQSRRAVRQQHERESAQAAVVPTTGPTPTPVAPHAPAEPLTYATQASIPAPNYDGPAPRSRRTPAPAGESSPAWAPQYGGAQAEPAAAPADASSAFAPHPPAQPVVLPSALDNEDPVEHTLTRRELRALRDAHGIAAPPEEVAPAHPGTPLAAPSTRLDSAVAEFDQLTGRNTAPAGPVEPAPARGRRAAAKPAETAPEAPAAPAAPAASGPARIAPDALGPVPVVSMPSASVPAPPETSAVDGVAVFDALFAAPVEPAFADPVAEAPRAVPEQAAPPQAPAQAQPPAQVQAQAQAPAQPVAPPPIESEVVVAEIVVEPDPAPASAPAPAAASLEPSTTTPPTGHWSTQAQLDDETQVGDAPLARNIGATSGAVTTSALVLPSIPNHDFGPIVTGDIMVTGSISLPTSLSATGAMRAQLDESDLDHLLDPGDSQVASTDSQPVRAIKAVSTHTSSRGVINTGKPKGTRGLTALIVAATSMAVIVGALFIVLVATGQL